LASNLVFPKPNQFSKLPDNSGPQTTNYFQGHPVPLSPGQLIASQALGFPNLNTLFIKQGKTKTTLRNHLTSAHDRGHGCSNSLLTSAEGVHFTHTTLLTRITQPVGISHVGRPPSFHDKAFRKPIQVYHMPTRGVPDQQQVRSQTILCQEAQGSSPTPPRRIHMSLGIKAPLIS